MKWTQPEKSRPYQVSGQWMMNRAYVNGAPVYMLVRLGKPDRGAWIGSEIVRVGSKAECERAANETVE